jgi:hypothetical protein
MKVRKFNWNGCNLVSDRNKSCSDFVFPVKMDDLNRKRILKIFEKLLVLQVNEMASVGGTLGYF